MKHILILLLISIISSCQTTSSIQYEEKISQDNLRKKWFKIDALDVDGLRDLSKAKQIKLRMKLGIPKGNGPFPTVIILHGSGNMKNRDDAIGARLLKNGIAWIGLYSYDSRGLKNKKWNQRIANSNVFDQISDAYHALKFVENHPLLNEKKVAVTGFSLGGISSYALSSSSISKKFNVSNSKFKLALNQYGPCIIFPTDPDPTLKIVNIWGKEDASTPYTLCNKLNDHLKSKNINSKAFFVEGAAHGWFRQSSPSLDKDGNFQCIVNLNANEMALNGSDKTPKNMGDLALMRFAGKFCGQKIPYKSYAHKPAEDLSIKILVNELKN